MSANSADIQEEEKDEEEFARRPKRIQVAGAAMTDEGASTG